jgi:hypothetical protein
LGECLQAYYPVFLALSCKSVKIFSEPLTGHHGHLLVFECSIAAARIADSNSANAVSFSFPRPTKRFPLPRCASAIQIVRPLESTAETQPQLHPALLRLSAMISQDFIESHFHA